MGRFRTERRPQGLSLKQSLNHYTAAGNPADCWEFKGSRSNAGYGRFKWQGRWYLAHRVALSYAVGRELVHGEVARHTCDNPPCCNPHHLALGSQADNNRDRARRDRNGVRGLRTHLQAKLAASNGPQVPLFVEGPALRCVIDAKETATAEQVQDAIKADRMATR